MDKLIVLFANSMVIWLLWHIQQVYHIISHFLIVSWALYLQISIKVKSLAGYIIFSQYQQDWFI